MKYILLSTFLVISLSFTCTGQTGNTDSVSSKIRNGIWLTPVSRYNTTINGLAVGLLAGAIMDAEEIYVNGVNLEASPLSVVGGTIVLVGSFISPITTDLKKTYSPHKNKNLDFFPYFIDSASKIQSIKINGLSISTGLPIINELNGVAINGIYSGVEIMNGLEITGLINYHYTFNGALIAGFRNKTTRGRGIQIALFNSCLECNAVQIGLINRIGKRVTPLINFSLKKNNSE